MYSDLCLSILNAYAQRFGFALLFVVDSPRVDFTLSQRCHRGAVLAMRQ